MGKSICGKGGFVIPANDCTLFLSCSSWPLLTEMAISVSWEPLAFSCAWFMLLVFCSHFVVELLLACCGMTSAFVFPVFRRELDSDVAQSASTFILVLCGSGECLPQWNLLCSASAPDGS